MAIQFPCSQCEKILTADEDAIGRPVMCSQCGQVTHVPDPSLQLCPQRVDGPASHYNVKIVPEFKPPVSLKQIESQTGWAIIVTLCFIPIAIVGMIFGSMAKTEFNQGHYTTAERYYKRAKFWTTLALGIWVGLFVILTFFIIIPALTSLPK